MFLSHMADHASIAGKLQGSAVELHGHRCLLDVQPDTDVFGHYLDDWRPQGDVIEEEEREEVFVCCSSILTPGSLAR